VSKILQERIGFLGGSFDPVHLGHLIIAQTALEEAGLDTVYFVPTAQSPLKGRTCIASAEDRMAMLRIALKGSPSFSILEDELQRGGVSYTIETVSRLRQRWPQAQLFWIIGADQLQKLPQWQRIGELQKAVTFIWLQRPGESPLTPQGIDPKRLLAIRSHQFEVSSTAIRERISSGLDARFFLPSGVPEYITKARLYGASAS